MNQIKPQPKNLKKTLILIPKNHPGPVSIKKPVPKVPHLRLFLLLFGYKKESGTKKPYPAFLRNRAKT